MFERFTDRARKVMALANQEARNLNHGYIGIEHVLLGLIKEGSGVGATVLKNLDIDLSKARLKIEELVLSGPDKVITKGKLPQVEEVKKLIEGAIEYARRLNDHHIGTEHILGSFMTQKGTVKKILNKLELKPRELEKELLGLLNKDIEEYSVLDNFSDGIGDYWRIPRTNMNLANFLETCEYQVQKPLDGCNYMEILKIGDSLNNIVVGRIGLTAENIADFQNVKVIYDIENKKQIGYALDLRDIFNKNMVEYQEVPPSSEVLEKLKKPIECVASLIERLEKRV